VAGFFVVLGKSSNMESKAGDLKALRFMYFALPASQIMLGGIAALNNWRQFSRLMTK
jgi:hypothetical protein